MIDRRTFLKGLVIGAAGLALPGALTSDAEEVRRYWSLPVRYPIVPNNAHKIVETSWTYPSGESNQTIWVQDASGSWRHLSGLREATFTVEYVPRAGEGFFDWIT